MNFRIPVRYFFVLLFCLVTFFSTQAQVEEEDDKIILDSLFIAEVEDKTLVPKVLHAEPLFVDLIRDLGARKGEREWNLGLSLTDNRKFDRYRTFVEYEFAPINRLGLEAEVTFDFFFQTDSGAPAPGNRMTSLKLAMQHSFWVSDKYKTTLAWGYLNELEFIEFNRYRQARFTEANNYNPFFVAAKRWGTRFHTLLLAGPEFIHEFSNNHIFTNWQINTNFHYMIPGTRNFVGIEFNKDINKLDFDMTIRPQIRVSITDDLLIGIVAGIPFRREEERLSSFMRIIYEPPHRPKKRY
jgi:hypothetical protein